MKKLLTAVIAITSGVVFIAPFSFSQSENPMNMVDAQGKRQGSWVITAGMMRYTDWSDPVQKVKEGSYQNSQEVGVWREYNKSGFVIAEVSYVAGQRDGIGKKYYDNGKLWSEYTWTNGRLDGPAKTYYPNGKLCEEGYWKHNYWDLSQPYTFHKK